MRCTCSVHNSISIGRAELTLGAGLDFAPSTVSFKGRANIMTMSWPTMIDFEPPIVGCVISNRIYSFSVLRSTRECVINIPTVELAAQVGLREHLGAKN